MLDVVCGYVLACLDPPIDYTAIEISRLSLDYELSFDTSFAKVDWLGTENGCCRQTDTKKIYV